MLHKDNTFHGIVTRMPRWMNELLYLINGYDSWIITVSESGGYDKSKLQIFGIKFMDFDTKNVAHVKSGKVHACDCSFSRRLLAVTDLWLTDVCVWLIDEVSISCDRPWHIVRCFCWWQVAAASDIVLSNDWHGMFSRECSRAHMNI